jgi:hypothetical protein
MRLDRDQNVLVYANHDELEQRANEFCLARTSLAGVYCEASKHTGNSL